MSEHLPSAVRTLRDLKQDLYKVEAAAKTAQNSIDSALQRVTEAEEAHQQRIKTLETSNERLRNQVMELQMKQSTPEAAIRERDAQIKKLFEEREQAQRELAKLKEAMSTLGMGGAGAQRKKALSAEEIAGGYRPARLVQQGGARRSG